MGGKGSLAHVCVQFEERLPWYVYDWGKGCCGMCSWEKGSMHVTGPNYCFVWLGEWVLTW